MRILPEDIVRLKKLHPRSLVLVHPECRPDAKAVADAVLSTGGMIRFVKESDAPGFIIGTETGIIHRLQKDNPSKYFIPVNDKAVCPNMKAITLEKVLWSLQDMKYKITVPEDIRVRALTSVQRMLAIP
jgi:quinolinate synthase